MKIFAVYFPIIQINRHGCLFLKTGTFYNQEMFAILCKHNQIIYDLDTRSKKKDHTLHINIQYNIPLIIFISQHIEVNEIYIYDEETVYNNTTINSALGHLFNFIFFIIKVLS